MVRGLLTAVLAAMVARLRQLGNQGRQRGSVTSIKSVALVASRCRRIVTEEAGGGSLAGISAAVATIKAAACAATAPRWRATAAGGFVDEMNKDGTLRFVAISQVVASGDFKALVGTYDQTEGARRPRGGL